jgi:hypothetical protein
MKKLSRLAQALLDLDRRVRATSRLAAKLERTCASCPHHDVQTSVIGFRFKQGEDEDEDEGLEKKKPRPPVGRTPATKQLG